jgi:hypothetical protein
MIELTGEQKAFLAGLLDAEGSLEIKPATIRIELKMTEYYEIFKWLSQLFNKNFMLYTKTINPYLEYNYRASMLMNYY